MRTSSTCATCAVSSRTSRRTPTSSSSRSPSSLRSSRSAPTRICATASLIPGCCPSSRPTTSLRSSAPSSIAPDSPARAQPLPRSRPRPHEDRRPQAGQPRPPAAALETEPRRGLTRRRSRARSPTRRGHDASPVSEPQGNIGRVRRTSADGYDGRGRGLANPCIRAIERARRQRLARSAQDVVRLRSERGNDDDVSKAVGRDRYDRNLGIAYDVNPAVNNSPRTLERTGLDPGAPRAALNGVLHDRGSDLIERVVLLLYLLVRHLYQILWELDRMTISKFDEEHSRANRTGELPGLVIALHLPHATDSCQAPRSHCGWSVAFDSNRVSPGRPFHGATYWLITG